jgi:ABC-type transporter Mla subunit MlaD
VTPGADTLKEDLTELSDVVPRVPEDVNELRQSANTLANEAAELLGETAAARQDVASLLAHVRNTLPGYTVQVETLDKRLEDALAAADKSWAEGGGHIDDGEKTLQTAAEHADSARSDLMGALFEAGTKVDQASSDGERAIEHLETTANEGADRIKAAATALTSQVATLETHLEQVHESLRDACELYLERVKQFVDSVHFDAGVLFDRLKAREEQYATHLQEVGGELESGTEAVMTALAKRVTAAVTEPLGLAGENLRIDVERLAVAAASQQTALVKSLEGHNTALGDLKEAAEPMARGVGEIHEAVVRMRQQ